jgi:salicylate hydroxylase
MDTFRDDWQWSFNAIQPLKVIVVGAGIAGLTAAICLKKAGHAVLILEQGAQITEVGAGIQVAPNASRILGRLGLLEQIMAKANALEMISLRRWQDDTELGTAPLMPSVSYELFARIHCADEF